jgi:hypothetical protein
LARWARTPFTLNSSASFRRLFSADSRFCCIRPVDLFIFFSSGSMSLAICASNLKLGMTDLAIGGCEPHDLARAKRPRVEVDVVAWKVAKNQLRSGDSASAR